MGIGEKDWSDMQHRREIAHLTEQLADLAAVADGLIAGCIWQSESGRWWHRFSGLTHFQTREAAVFDLENYARRRAKE